ncbi:MAG TPA: SpoIVB peptidase S55 domain-containing protein [Bryobacteraceae bacterium]|nr:SpoIVB peptidase S55 domain-containing protein [Bryobacteraceae bacterium]
MRSLVLLIVASHLFAQTVSQPAGQAGSQGAGQPAIFPLKDIRPGQSGIGKTIFSGSKVEEFQVEVLGVLENLGPKQSIILARLSGGPLEKTGVMQGMSGSPVYIDGKLVGAVALAFPFSKDAIAGIRPIEEMLAINEPRRAVAALASLAPLTAPVARLNALAPKANQWSGGLTEIATPLSFAGFTQPTLDYFAPELRKLGLEPMQGVSSGGQLPSRMGNSSTLKPGDMITVQLLSGDWSIGADGTVTAIDANKVYAFGHRFLSVGNTELPFARSNVVALLPNLQSSFKISSAKEWMGTITQDRSTSIYGELGREAFTIPLNISLDNHSRPPLVYHTKMVNDRVLSPLLVQMVVFSVIDATERALGMGSFTVKGEARFDDGLPPVRFDNTYAGDFNVPLQVSLGISAPLAYALGTGFDALKVKSIDLSIEASEKRSVLQIDQVTASPREVHPGETVEVVTTLSGDNGVETMKTVQYHVPVGLQAGPLYFTVADASSTNVLDYQQLLSAQPKSPSQVLSFLNGLRPNTDAYVRVWRADPGFQSQGAELPDPPASVALIFGKAQAAQLGASLTRGSKLAELRIHTGDAVVAGTKTIQVDVKE